MKTKKSKKNKGEQEVIVQEGAGVFVEEITKSRLQASSIYEYKKLAMPNIYFMNCEIKEEKESLEITYQIGEMKPVLSLKTGNKLKKLEVLIQVGKLDTLVDEYTFSLSPNNLYYDEYGQLKVMHRDLRKGEANAQMEFLKTYRALIGSLLSSKYNYEDILQGGQSFLKENKELKEIGEAETIDDVKAALSALYKKIAQEEKKTRINVGRGKYKILVTYAILSLVIMLALGGITAYTYVLVLPKQKQILLAGDAYIETNYVRVIDALKDFEIEELERHQKYILAIAYIQSQSIDTFRGEEKEIVLSKISHNGNEDVLEYWIYLGRLQMDEAQSMAMKLADDQLLLYAYIQELSQVEKDQTISGVEKSAKSNELMTKITTLADKLGIAYEEETIADKVEENTKENEENTKENEEEGDPDNTGDKK